jgi:hypothetical protein
MQGFKIVVGAEIVKSKNNGFLFTEGGSVVSEFEDYGKAVNVFMGRGLDDESQVALVSGSGSVLAYFNEDGDYCDGADG